MCTKHLEMLILFETVQTSVGGVPERREHLQQRQPVYDW